MFTPVLCGEKAFKQADICYFKLLLLLLVVVVVVVVVVVSLLLFHEGVAWRLPLLRFDSEMCVGKHLT